VCLYHLKVKTDCVTEYYSTFVWPCIIYENGEIYQHDATIVIYNHKYRYMFWAPICPSSGVQVICYCIWCSALGVVVVVLRSWCVVLCNVCKLASDCSRCVSNFHTVHKTTHLLLRTTTTTPSAEHHTQ
jgi:hypothetical protein